GLGLRRPQPRLEPDLAVAQAARFWLALFEGRQGRLQAGDLARLIVGARPQGADLALVGEPGRLPVTGVLTPDTERALDLGELLVRTIDLACRAGRRGRRSRQPVAAAQPALQTVDQLRLVACLGAQLLELRPHRGLAFGICLAAAAAARRLRAGQALDMRTLLRGNGRGLFQRLLVAPAPDGQFGDLAVAIEQ